MLNDRIKSYEENKENIKKIKYPTPAKYKKDFEFLKEVDSLALANAQLNLDKSYKNFFRDKSVGLQWYNRIVTQESNKIKYFMEVFMINKYDIEFKRKIVRLFLQEGRTKKSISNEFSVSVATISNWVRQFRDECQINEKANDEYNYMKENLRLRKELEDAKKENEFLKKAVAFFTKEID